MESFLHIDEENFEPEVLKSDLPVMVEFGAAWCAPCKRLEPELKQLSQEWSGRVKLGKVDVDESVNLAVRFGVMSVPTVLLFVKGQVMQRLIGYQPRQRFVEKFSAYTR